MASTGVGGATQQAMTTAAARDLRRLFDRHMATFEVELVTATDAAEMRQHFTAMKRRLEAAELACARRVAQTRVVRTRADRDGTRWAGKQLGVSQKDAGKRLELAERLEQFPSTRQALEAGRISTDQADEITRTAEVRPEAEADLLAVAPRESVGELRKRGRALRAASEAGEERLQQLRQQRYLRTWTDPDGAGRGSWSLPPLVHAEVLAALEPHRARLFDEARRAGRREPAEAYQVDALVELSRDASAYRDLPIDDDDLGATEDGTSAGEPGEAADTASPTDTMPSAPPDRPRPRRRPPRRSDGSRSKVIVRFDWAAIRRGHTEPGETCDVVGLGPISIAEARELLHDNPFIAAVLTDAQGVRDVTHLGRKASALLRTALEWENQGCSVLGCPNTAHLEIDHAKDWATTHHTRLDELDLFCVPHHRQKTHDGYQLEPGRGKRRFLSPEERAALEGGGPPTSSTTSGAGGPTTSPPAPLEGAAPRGSPPPALAADAGSASDGVGEGTARAARPASRRTSLGEGPGDAQLPFGSAPMSCGPREPRITIRLPEPTTSEASVPCGSGGRVTVAHRRQRVLASAPRAADHPSPLTARLTPRRVRAPTPRPWRV
jgi:hypothetical protein